MPDLTGLTQHGDTLELDDGRMLRLLVEPDQDTSVTDFDCYGRFEWTRENDYGPVRPHDFTGRARILKHSWHESLWWEPYEELTEQQIRTEQPRFGT